MINNDICVKIINQILIDITNKSYLILEEKLKANRIKEIKQEPKHAKQLPEITPNSSETRDSAIKIGEFSSEKLLLPERQKYIPI